MADYHIYIHSEETDSPTKPEQTKEKSKNKKTKPTDKLEKVLGLVENPDSAISMAKNSVVGGLKKTSPYVAAAVIVVGALAKITDKCITAYNSYASTASGDYRFLNDYQNTKQGLHNIFHPFSTEIARQQAELQNRVNNARNEQNSLLLGGTIYNSQYGRYL